MSRPPTEFVCGAKDYIGVALDVKSLDVGLRLIEPIVEHVGCIKVGLELLHAEGTPKVVKAIRGLGVDVFCDVKLVDIPTTVGNTSKVLSDFGAKMFNVYAGGDPKSLKSAMANGGDSLVIAVTVLTTMDDDECESVFNGTVDETVERLVKLAFNSNMDGIVCSAADLAALKAFSQRDPNFDFDLWMYVTPGIRSAWAPPDEQKRLLTPYEAILAGSDLLIMGRPILKPPPEIGSPLEAVKRITDEIEQALEEMRREQRS